MTTLAFGLVSIHCIETTGSALAAEYERAIAYFTKVQLNAQYANGVLLYSSHTWPGSTLRYWLKFTTAHTGWNVLALVKASPIAQQPHICVAGIAYGLRRSIIILQRRVLEFLTSPVKSCVHTLPPPALAAIPSARPRGLNIEKSDSVPDFCSHRTPAMLPFTQHC